MDDQKPIVKYFIQSISPVRSQSSLETRGRKVPGQERNIAGKRTEGPADPEEIFRALPQILVRREDQDCTLSSETGMISYTLVPKCRTFPMKLPFNI